MLTLTKEKTEEAEQVIPTESVQLIEEGECAKARASFWQFRTILRPNLTDSWWQHTASDNLTEFYRQLQAGKRPKLVLGAPPQHGKSDIMKDFCCWVAGKNPDGKIIFASYADELGISANLHMQRMMQLPAYRTIFPKTRLAEGPDDPGRSRRTTTFLEFVNRDGSFRNTTINGKINGFGLDLGVIDDPIKGRAEAQSQLIRDKTWEWLTHDFFNRFSNTAGMVMIQTRWHVDDPTGRWLERFPNTRVLNYKAIATERERFRARGEALFPEHKSIEFLVERKKTLTEAGWEALYQQNPFVQGGGIFPIEKLRVLPVIDRSKVRKSVRYWDKAASTAEDAAHSAGVLMHIMHDDSYVVEHVVRGQWLSREREEHIKRWAQHDRERTHTGAYEIGVEQEPGSGGKESAENTIRNLAGFRVFADKVTGSKEVRAEPFASQVQGNNVWMVAGAWHREYLNEMETFPMGKTRDMVDASSGAFNRLIAGAAYNLWAEGLYEDK